MIKKNNIEYEELEIPISEIKDGDLVQGTDLKWHRQHSLPSKVPDRMFKFIFSKPNHKNHQYLECDDKHLWLLFNENGSLLLEADKIYNELDKFKGFHVGEPLGPILYDIQEIPVTDKVRCIQVDSDNEMFKVLTENDNNEKHWELFTHNCGFKMVCGKVGMTASRMMFDNGEATLIDGNHKGAGMAKVGGDFYSVQVYFEKYKWIEQWYADRGLSPTGLEPGETTKFDEDKQADNVNLGEDNEEIDYVEDKKEIKMGGLKTTIDDTKHQKFEEV